MSFHTPKAAGYHMPPEWAPHARTWMMWPCRRQVWDDLDETRANYVTVAHAVREFEPLTMLVHPRDKALAAAAGSPSSSGLPVAIWATAPKNSMVSGMATAVRIRRKG